MARGAIISMMIVIGLLPSFLIAFDQLKDKLLKKEKTRKEEKNGYENKK